MTSSVPPPTPCSLLLRKLCDTTVLEQSVPVLATLGRLPQHFSVVPGSQPGLFEGFWFFPCHEKQITPRWHPKYQQFSFSGEFAGVPEKVGVPCCFYWKASCICSSNFCPNSCVLWAWLYGPIRSVTIYTLPNLDSSVYLHFQLHVWADGRCSGNTLLFC